MLTFVGDFFAKRPVKVELATESDLIVNLEAPLTSSFETPAPGKVNLKIDADVFFKSFIDLPVAVCLANNHIFDYGDTGYIETLNHLRRSGIHFFGAGTVEDNFNNPYTYKHEDKQIDVFGYCDKSTSPAKGLTYRVAPLCLDRINKDLSSSSALIKVVCLHWGDEENKYPSKQEIECARKIIELGANIIVGHHAHVVQSYELFKGKPIYYNIGNFHFEDLNEPSNWSDGKFRHVYVKKQRRNNRSGLAINLDFEKFTAQSISFYENCISMSSKTRLHGLPRFSCLYEIIKRYNLMRIMIHRFWKNPRIPTMNQLRRFIGG